MEGLLKTFDLEILDAQMILVCVVLFVIFWKTLARVLINPMIRLSEARQNATSGAEHNAVEIAQQAEALAAEYEKKLSAARGQAIQERLDAIKEANIKAEGIVKAAEQEAQQLTEKSRAGLKATLTEVEARLMRDADSMVDSIVQKLKAPREAGSGR